MVSQSAWAGPDCNNNGIDDATDIANGTSFDCDGSGMPDECELVIPFAPVVTEVGLGTNPYASAKPIDFDGDGDLDVVWASFNNNLYFLENNGFGRFDLHSTFSINFFANDPVIRVSDFDRDGDFDILICGRSSQPISWLENVDGLGADWNLHDVAGETGFWDLIEVLDVDSDGDDDFVATATTGNSLYLHINDFDNSQSFSSPVLIESLNRIKDIVATDLDGDGDIDLLIGKDDATTAPSFGWMENLDGLGGFSPFTPIPDSIHRTSAVAAGDLDGDGDIDVLQYTPNNRFILWYENLDGQGVFGNEISLFPPPLTLVSMLVFDIDNDGDLDIIVGGSNNFLWRENVDGAATFSSYKFFSLPANNLRELSPADLNGDGFEDLLIAARTTSSIIYLAGGDQDCDDNGVRDDCDIDNGAADCNQNGLPDVCELQGNDCNSNGVPDECESDCDSNGLIDECEPLNRLITEILPYTLNGSSGLAIGDIDNDGDPDIVTTLYQLDSVVWLENSNALGSFSEPEVLIDSLASPYLLALCDVDEDGASDLIIGSNVNQLNWSRNLGEAGFGAPILITNSIESVVSMTVKDVNGDSRDDLIVISYFGFVGWFENIGGPTGFGPIQIITNQLAGAFAVDSGDIDGDGDNDIAVCDQNSGLAVWFENLDGAGSFGMATIIDDIAESPYRIRVVDVDNDTDGDVVLLVERNGTPYWYSNNDGIGQSWSSRPTYLGASGFHGLAVADIDGDDRADILSGRNTGIAWCTRWNQSGHQWTRQHKTGFGPGQGENIASIIPVDIDLDGDIDVVSNSFFDGEIYVSFNISDDCNEDGIPDRCGPDCDFDHVLDTCEIDAGQELDCDLDGRIDRCQTVTEFVEAATGYDFDFSTLATGDIDGDSDIDVLMGVPNVVPASSDLQWFAYSSVTASYGNQQDIAINGDSATDVALADIDGDGDLDALLVSTRTDRVCFYLNQDGLGNFGPRQVISSALSDPFNIVSGDVDGDGDLDIVVAATGIDRVVWFENQDGEGTFGSANDILNTSLNPTAVQLADIDRDGNLDVVIATSSDSTLGWFPNPNGNGSFGTRRIISATAGTIADLVSIDFDRDGDVDVMTASAAGNLVGWYPNANGSGEFGPQIAISTESASPRFVRAADIDRDGDLDPITMVRGFVNPTIDLSWKENLGGGLSFGPENMIVRLSTNALPVGIDVLDIDGEGDIDVLIAEPSRIRWFHNLSNDCNGNGVPDSCEPDSDGDGLIDACEFIFGDMNCDGFVDLNDVSAFALAMVDLGAYNESFTPCDFLSGDFTDDDMLAGSDIAGFVELLTGL